MYSPPESIPTPVVVHGTAVAVVHRGGVCAYPSARKMCCSSQGENHHSVSAFAAHRYVGPIHHLLRAVHPIHRRRGPLIRAPDCRWMLPIRREIRRKIPMIAWILPGGVMPRFDSWAYLRQMVYGPQRLAQPGQPPMQEPAC